VSVFEGMSPLSVARVCGLCVCVCVCVCVRVCMGVSVMLERDASTHTCVHVECVHT